MMNSSEGNKQKEITNLNAFNEEINLDMVGLKALKELMLRLF